MCVDNLHVCVERKTAQVSVMKGERRDGKTQRKIN